MRLLKQLEYNFPCLAFMTAKSLDYIFIGGTDAATEGTWVWTDGNPFGSYTHWHQRQPDNFRHNQDCAALNFRGYNGFWDDIGCTAVHHYLCQKPDASVI